MQAFSMRNAEKNEKYTKFMKRMISEIKIDEIECFSHENAKLCLKHGKPNLSHEKDHIVSQSIHDTTCVRVDILESGSDVIINIAGSDLIRFEGLWPWPRLSPKCCQGFGQSPGQGLDLRCTIKASTRPTQNLIKALRSIPKDPE